MMTNCASSTSSRIAHTREPTRSLGRLRKIIDHSSPSSRSARTAVGENALCSLASASTRCVRPARTCT